MIVLHLTHTDVRTDSRILKEISCLVNAGYNVVGVGINFDEGSIPSDFNKNLNLVTILIKSNELRKKKFVPRFFVHFLIFIELFFKLIWQIKKYKPKVVHCHDTFVLPLGVLSKILYRSKVIYDAHELESKKAGLSKLSSIATLFLEKICWRFIDAFIVVSKSIENWYLENFNFKKSAVILNSPMFDKDEIQNEKKYLRELYDIPLENKIFVYVGLFGVERSIKDLIDVFSRQDISSHIVFIGFGELECFIKSSAEKFHNIHYHPAVKHDFLVSIVSSADFGLCLIPNSSLSDFYCLPNKLFEYVFSKIPILVSNLPEISKFVIENDFGFVCELDVDSIYKQVKIAQASERVFNFDESKLSPFSWQEQESKIVQLYSVL